MHRDLKPENILMRHKGSNFELAIADFGLSYIEGNETHYIRCGTPGYVAPEILN